MSNDKLDLILQGINEINEKLNSINTKELKDSLDELKMMLGRQNNTLYDDISILIDAKINNNIGQIESLMAIYNFLPDVKFLPTSRGWAGSPDFLLKLLEIIFKNKPNVIVELGSGLSTVVIGSALKKVNNGRLISFDHDERFLKNTKANVKLNKVGDFVSLNYTPLVQYNNGYKWYDLTNVSIESKIDLLIVDGPPRIIQKNARFPALPLLLEQLSNECIIVLDDANRNDEQEIIEMWMNLLDEKKIIYIKETLNFYDKGLVILDIQKTFITSTLTSTPF